ncbi:MAG: WbuC family cupin fold metalloprotein [Gammaproteobacteria bacterium]
MKYIDRALIAQLHEKAQASPRLRTHYNLHLDHDDPIQRMCMAMEPGTYICPHRHPDKWELLLIVSGEMLVLTFDDVGTVLTRTLLSAGGYTYGVENPAGIWHAVVTLAPSTVVFECKAGPYRPVPEQDFASWAPSENHVRAAEFERWYKTAQPGDQAPAYSA